MDEEALLERRITPLRSPVSDNRSEFKAAWFVSRCNSTGGRERLLGALRRFMKVDVYGKCGNLNCSKEGG